MVASLRAAVPGRFETPPIRRCDSERLGRELPQTRPHSALGLESLATGSSFTPAHAIELNPERAVPGTDLARGGEMRVARPCSVAASTATYGSRSGR